MPDGRTIPVTITGRDVASWGKGMGFTRGGSIMIDASMPVHIEGSNKSTDELKAELFPMFQQQQETIIRRVRELNEEDPNFLT